MKRVLFLGLKIFSVGGIEQVNKNWLYAFSKLSKEKSVSFKALSIYDDNIDKRYVDENTIEVCNSNKWLFGLKAIWNAIRSDVVIISHLNLSLFVSIAKLISPRTKLFVQVHGIEAWRELSGIQEKLLFQAHSILAVSDFTKQSLISRYPSLESKTIVLPNSLDPIKEYRINDNNVNSFREKIGVDKHQKLIITVGRIHHEEAYKGYDKTIEALHLLKNENVVFHIIGKYDRIEQQRIFELLIKFDLVGQVKSVGYVSDEDLDLYYQSADLFVMPSVGEGFGLVFIDAMANGLRVIGGNKDGSVDAIGYLDPSGLISPFDVQELSDAIKSKLSTDWSTENKMELSNKCKSLFSKEVFEKNIETIIL